MALIYRFSIRQLSMHIFFHQQVYRRSGLGEMLSAAIEASSSGQRSSKRSTLPLIAEVYYFVTSND